MYFSLNLFLSDPFTTRTSGFLIATVWRSFFKLWILHLLCFFKSLQREKGNQRSGMVAIIPVAHSIPDAKGSRDYFRSSENLWISLCVRRGPIVLVRIGWMTHSVGNFGAAGDTGRKSATQRRQTPNSATHAHNGTPIWPLLAFTVVSRRFVPQFRGGFSR